MSGVDVVVAALYAGLETVRGEGILAGIPGLPLAVTLRQPILGETVAAQDGSVVTVRRVQKLALAPRVFGDKERAIVANAWRSILQLFADDYRGHGGLTVVARAPVPLAGDVALHRMTVVEVGTGLFSEAAHFKRRGTAGHWELVAAWGWP